MDPLSITAGVVGITAPTLHCVRLLAQDIQRIADAPDTVATLRDDLAALEKALTSLQDFTDAQWKSLGDSVVESSKAAMTGCVSACDKFRTELAYWNRHSAGNGKMSWRDKASVGLFKQGQLKTLSDQLQSCKTTLNFVVSSATLRNSILQGQTFENIAKMISASETGVMSALATTNDELNTIVTQSALQQSQASEDIIKMISASDAAVTSALATTNDQLSAMSTQLSALQQGRASEGILKTISAGDAEVTSALTATNDRLNAMVTQLSALQVATQASAAQQEEASEAIQRGLGRINSVPRRPPEPPSAPPKPFANIPISRDPGFVNRGDIIEQMHKKCAEPPQRVALVGLGGVGKSQLVIEFAHQIAETSPDTWIFWIHAANRGLVQQGFRTIADAVHLPGRNDHGANIPLLVSSWLSNPHNGKWVIVLDSADDQTVFYKTAPVSEGSSNTSSSPLPDDTRPLASYLPQTANGSILVTTRDGGLAFKLTGSRHNSLPIGVMSSGDALRLLETRLGSPFGPADRLVAEQLVEALERIPLAISQAAGYIQQREPRMSVAKYLEEFQKGDRRRVRLLEQDIGDLRRDGAGAVLTTWTMSFEQILRDQESATNLLATMSFFEPQDIPAELLKGWWVRQPLLWRQGRQESAEEESDGEADDMFEDDIALLRNYSLISATGMGDKAAFSMHALVQLSTRRWLQALGLQDGYRMVFLDFLTSAVQEFWNSMETWSTAVRLLPHVDAVIKMPPGSTEDAAYRAELMDEAGWYYWRSGEFGAGERLLREAQRANEQAYGPDSKEALHATLILAYVEQKLRPAAETEAIYVRIIDTLSSTLGPKHSLTIFAMGALAAFYFSQRRVVEAEAVQVKIGELRLAADDLKAVESRVPLAAIYQEQGRCVEAQQVASTVLEFYSRRTEGLDLSLHWTSYLLEAVNVYARQGRWEEVKQVSLERVEALKTTLGADHNHTLDCMERLSWILEAAYLFTEAGELRAEVLARRAAKLGPCHVLTLQSMERLATTWAQMGRSADATELMRRCVQLHQETFGPAHRYTADLVATLAYLEELRKLKELEGSLVLKEPLVSCEEIGENRTGVKE